MHDYAPGWARRSRQGEGPRRTARAFRRAVYSRSSDLALIDASATNTRAVPAVLVAGVRRHLHRERGCTIRSNGNGGVTGRVRRGLHRTNSRGTQSSEAGRVLVVVREVGLLQSCDVLDVTLGLGVVALLALVQEDRNSNGGENADDDDDDQELDEGEATLVLLLGLADASEHLCDPFPLKR